MLEHEKTAARLYQEAAGLADDYSMRTWLAEQVKEEQQHAAIVENIIKRLSGEKA
jgi:rubrerythrin